MSLSGIPVEGIKMLNMSILVGLFLMMASFPLALGHGRLIDPPARSSMWRFGFNTVPNYEDNELFCGGAPYQWNVHGGKCGICGDPYDGPFLHEAGGIYASGIIAENYTKGQVIDVTVELTAHHEGWFEFRLCEHNDPTTRANHECFDQHLLELADGAGTRYDVTIRQSSRFYSTRLQLPQDVTCTQCILQWKYHTGNSWGIDPVTGEQCIGCGPQEEFYGCADIAIVTG